MSLVCIDDFEKKAFTLIEKKALDFYKSGAGEEFTLNLNREAFKRLRIRPFYLRDVSKLDTTCEILGSQLKWPVGIAPTGMLKMAHNDGEAGIAIAAGKAGSIFILSTLSTMSIEEVAQLAPDTCKWFQLYVHKDRNLTEQLIRRAEKANFKAIVLTVDVPTLGQRRADLRNNFSLSTSLRLANFDGIQGFGVKTDKSNSSGIREYVARQFDPTLTWKDVEWLVQKTHLPVVLKGILTQEDAILARQFGCKGIIVSNHGARQLDSVPASIEALPEVVAAVGNDLIVMFDGGIRQGNDVLKALALGAKYVFIGRPAIWGLACNGSNGVEQMLSVLQKDFETTLKLTGCQRLADITRQTVVHESYYYKL